MLCHAGRPMKIIVRTGSSLELTDESDLRRFEIEALCAEGDLAKSVTRLGEYDPPQHAWVHQDWILTNARGRSDTAWRSAFSEMVAKAAKYGWVRDTDGAIRAHITRPIVLTDRKGDASDRQ